MPQKSIRCPTSATTFDIKNCLVDLSLIILLSYSYMNLPKILEVSSKRISFFAFVASFLFCLSTAIYFNKYNLVEIINIPDVSASEVVKAAGQAILTPKTLR